MKRLLLLLCLASCLLAGVLPAILSAQSFADPAFESVWQRTDRPVAEGRTARSWMWGPAPFTDAVYEPYQQSPGGARLVQYFDKSRMEVNDPNGDRASPWFVTNGLLVREMVDGRVQTGDASHGDRAPAQEAVAGDPVAHNNPSCPTYASFTYLTWSRADNRTGQKVTATLSRDATVGEDSAKAGYSGTEIAHYEEATGHNVPRVLWDFMNQSGLIYVGGAYRAGKVVDWLFAMGYPISEAYWTRCTVAGEEKDVLVQLFERRVLTYTPANPSGWQVEMGNVGQHYYNWRYGAAAPPAPAPTPATNQTAYVSRIIDGDTIEVNLNGQTYRVRYIGVNTPEQGESFYTEATEYNRRMVEYKTVQMEKDVSETDRYGRLLRYVYYQEGGQWHMVNAALLYEGLAFAYPYPPDVKYQDWFQQLEDDARANGRGMWGAPPPSSGEVRITYIYYDGQVPYVESDEYAVIENAGGTAVNLSGWHLNAGDPGQNFWFPDFAMQPGQQCRVYTNEYHPDWCGFSFGSGKALWNNKGDCGYLFDATEVVVSTYCYP